MRKIVGTLTAHPHDGGHAIDAYIENYGRGDWREGVTGSLYSPTRGDSAPAPNRGEAMRRACQRLRDMAARGEEAAAGNARKYLPGAPGATTHAAKARYYADAQTV